MTVSSTTNRKTYTGDAVTTSFSTSPVVFFDTSDLVVYVVVTATGVAETLTENTHYTVTGGDGAVGTVNLAGGSAPYGAPAATKKIVIVREVPATQETDFGNNDTSDAEVVEDALDRLTMLAQQNNTKLVRSLRQPDEDPTDIAALPNSVDRASLYLAFDANGDPVATAGTTSDLVATPFIETLLDDATAAAARATLDVPSNAEAILDTIMDAAGDWIQGSAADTAAKFPAYASVAAHASTMDPWGARVVLLTGGAVTFTDMADADYVGQRVLLIMNAAHVFTDGAVFDVQGGANYTAAAGDWVEVVATAVDVFDVTIHKATGVPVTMSPITNSLSGDVALNNTGSFFTGPTVAQGTAGTWFASGSVTLIDTGVGAQFNVKLWDGTTVIASAAVATTAANEQVVVALSGYLASPAGNIRISVQDATATTGVIKFNSSGASKDATVSAIRIA